MIKNIPLYNNQPQCNLVTSLCSFFFFWLLHGRGNQLMFLFCFALVCFVLFCFVFRSSDRKDLMAACYVSQSVSQCVKLLVYTFCIVHIFLTQGRIRFTCGVLMPNKVGNIMRVDMLGSKVIISGSCWMKHKGRSIYWNLFDIGAILHNILLEFGPAPGHLHVRGCLILSSGIINHNIGWDVQVVVKLVLIAN